LSSEDFKNTKRKVPKGKRRRRGPKKRPRTIDTRLSNGFELFSVDSLDPQQRGRVESFVKSIAPKAGLVAVGKGYFDWDLRPVIALAQEEGPSVIRLLGPEVSKNKEALATVRHTFESLQKHGSLNADFRQWGEYQGQLWFRRELSKDTLFSRLSGEVDLTINEAETIIRSLVEEIALWHKKGVIHGHISHSNIVVTPAHGVVMLDAAAGAALLCSIKNPEILEYKFAAPEVIERGALSDRADLYGLGLVIQKLVNELKKKYKQDPANQESLVAFGAFNSLAGKLTVKDPFKRISIQNLVKEVAKIKIPLPKEVLKVEANADFAIGIENHEHKTALEDPSPFEQLLGEPEPVKTQIRERTPKKKEFNPKALASPVVSKKQGLVFNPKQGKPPVKQNAKPRNNEPQNKRTENKKPEQQIEKTAVKQTVRKNPIKAAGFRNKPAKNEPVENKSAENSAVTKEPIEKLLENEAVKKETIKKAPVEKPASSEDDFSLDDLLSFDSSEDVSKSDKKTKAKSKPEPVENNITEEAVFDPFDGAFEEFEKTTNKQAAEKQAAIDEKKEDTFDPFAGAFIDDEDVSLDFDEKPKFKKLNRKSASSNSNNIAVYLLIVGCLLLGIWYFFRGIDTVETVEYSVPEIRAAWDSKIPSRMLTVAELAVDSEVENKLVQDIVVSSAKNGRKLPAAVNTSLLRVAFHDRWEMELNSEDRRFAVALGLAGLLRNKMPTDLGMLTERHPGVILAITASAGKNTRKILEKIPALSLANLAPPFGPAFQKLVESNESLSCADESVHLLARFGTKGIQGIDSQDVIEYLAKDSSIRLQALSLMVSYDDLAARKMLDVLLNNPNTNFKSAESAWAKVWELKTWPNIDAADKLFILAGIPPASKVSLQHLRTLFSHPSDIMRSYAISQAKTRLTFKHPGAEAVFAMLGNNSSLLSGEQLLRLGQILEAPLKVSEQKIKGWLETNPPVEVVSALLLSRSNSNEINKTDTWFAYYLKNAEWSPNKEQLKSMILHPDRYTRLYTYTEIQKRVTEETIDATEALHLFQNALANEKDPEYQEQLQLMIGQF